MVMLPTLSSSGWVDDTVTIASTLMDYFLITEASQSNFFKDHLSSLPYLVQKYGAEPALMEDQTSQTLQRYFSRYFDVSTINVTVEDVNTSDDGRYSLKIEILLVRNGEQHYLGRLVEIGGSKVINYQSMER